MAQVSKIESKQLAAIFSERVERVVEIRELQSKISLLKSEIAQIDLKASEHGLYVPLVHSW